MVWGDVEEEEVIWTERKIKDRTDDEAKMGWVAAVSLCGISIVDVLWLVFKREACL